MSQNFAAIVEDVKNLSAEEKEELKFLLEQYILEERRNQIHMNYQESLTEMQEGKIKFRATVNELQRTLEE
ncbi:hypothetical protein [Desulfoferrobacter suflitae]|uniref:hypothetical protein n=1 Tax=Desulfoferrobacter suflitae TaxID=2865782 RepID=UPI002164D7C0|nr:hypothetical protein [Desulfoferrobacter suflitae]MCK8602710.1 hypothetical protein [Desulfoferrobacter suflitae]